MTAINWQKFFSSFLLSSFLISNIFVSVAYAENSNVFPNWFEKTVNWLKDNKISSNVFFRPVENFEEKKSIKISSSFKPTCSKVLIYLDKASYTIDEKFYLTVVSPHANKNPSAQDKIHVSVSSSVGDMPGLGIPYWETGISTGTFKHLGGFEPHFETKSHGLSWITSVAPNSLIVEYTDPCNGQQHKITANLTSSKSNVPIKEKLPEKTDKCGSCSSNYEPIYNDLVISHIEITQAIQDKQNSVPLVEGKNTWIRLYIDNHSSKKAGISNEKISAKISLIEASGAHPKNKGVNNLEIFPYNGPISIKSESFDSKRKDPNKTLNFQIPFSWTLHDEIKIKIEINPKNSKGEHAILESDYLNNVYPLFKLNFHKTKPLEINYHPTTVDADWCKEPSVSDLENILNEFTMKIFPVSYYKIKNDSSLSRDNILEANFYGITFLEATLEWEQCKNYPKACTFGPSPPNIEFALVCKPSSEVPLTHGMGFKSKAWAYPDAETVAHELAHARGMGHTPVDPKDYWDTQIDSDTFQTKVEQWTITCSDSKPSNPIIGEWAEDDWVPINPNLHRPSIVEYGFDGQNVYPPEIYSDVMSYCDTVGPGILNEGKWISPYTYKKLLDKFLIN